MNDNSPPVHVGSLEKLLRSKSARRSELAARPIAEKLRMLDDMRERETAIRARMIDRTSPASSVTDRAIDETGEELLARILESRRNERAGRGKYVEPASPATSNLPSLPRTWTWATLQQLSRSSSYGTSAKCSYENSGPPVLRIPNIARGRIDLDDLKYADLDNVIAAGDELVPGDLLIIRTNGSRSLIGRSTVVREQLTSATGYASYLIRFRLCGVPSLFDWIACIWDAPFLRAWIEERAATSAGQHNISMSTLNMLPIPLPPLDEQQRIVAEVEKQFTRLEVGIASLKRTHANLTRYKDAVLTAACEGRLENGGADLRRSARAGDLPRGWSVTTLEKACAIFVDSAHRTPKYATAGPYALGPRDVVNGILNLSRARCVSEAEFAMQTRRRIPQAGDIVYSRELSLGWAAAIPEGVRVCLSQGMCLFRPREGVLDRYLLAVLNGPIGRRQARAAATGSAHPHINLSDIRSYAIPLPTLAEQKRIVAEVERRLSVVEELAQVVEAILQRAKNLRQSILRRAFSGLL